MATVTSLDLSLDGSNIKIAVNGGAKGNLFYENPSQVQTIYDNVGNTVTCIFPGYNLTAPISSTTINTVAITSQAVFEAQMAILTPSASNAPASNVTIGDGVTPTQKATVAQFHNTDNQNVGSGNGLLTGGVAQLLNAAGNLDRQRETGTDSIPAAGISTGAAQNAQPFSTTHTAATIAGSAIVFTPAAMSGNTSGAPWSIQVGSVLVLEPTPVGGAVPANQETVVVTATTSTTFTAKANKTHGAGFSISGFVYNQSRDATAPDGAAGQGYAAAGTYLYNQTLNSNNGGWERERSAAGELDGASGVGTAVAAEYEWNGGAPGNANYDRARNLQAKLKNTGTVTGGSGTSAGVTSITVSSVTGLAAGEQLIIDRGTGNQEVVYVSASYVPGNLTVLLNSATTQTHANGATVEWDDFAANGPGLNGFLATGVGIEEECVYDPNSNLYYIERAATNDAMPAPNIVAENPALWNGATMDRQRGNVDSTLVTLSAASASGNSADQVNVNGRGVQLVIDVTAITGTTPSITVTIQGKDAASGKYYTLLQSAAISTVSTNLLTIYPGGLNAANVASPTVLPRTFRVLYSIAGTTPAITATIGASIIV